MNKILEERSILFSTPMVQAILNGSKTQTRRVMKVQPHIGRYGNGEIINDNYFLLDHIPLTEDCKYRWIMKCPYGQERLWVRETWRPAERESDSLDGILFRADNEFQPIKNTLEAADKWIDVYNNNKSKGKWKPSIHMPRWASRITLEITNIRVERLQDISEEDAKAEGVEVPAGLAFLAKHTNGAHLQNRVAFSSLWDKINGKTYPWTSNPFVWVINFKKV